MEIAVVGGGPGGTWASILLARHGHSVTLLDPQAPWEKPCGGGITWRAIDRFDVFAGELPRKSIEEVTVYFGDRNSVKVAPKRPPAIVSRRELAQFLLNEAQRCGVRLLHQRVTGIQRESGRWRVATKSDAIGADFIVGADGATSFVRRSLGTPFSPQDLCITMGYYIPGDVPPAMKIFFVPALEGYIWSFPRPNHISYGLISKSGPGRTARAKELLANFISADLGSDAIEQGEFYSAPVPCLSPASWTTNVISGERWALVGDAAGLTDPITGEGIYFAFRSAEILADNIDRPAAYSKAIWEDMGQELQRGARMYGKFYSGQFLGADFRKRAVQLARRSRTIRQLIETFIEGNQSYMTLKKKLFLSVPSVAWDLVSRRQ